MTIIVACKDEEDCVLGCDTAAVSGLTITDRGSKLIEFPTFTLAFAGSYRAADIVREDPDDFIKLNLGEGFEMRGLKDLAILRDAIKYLLDQENIDEAVFLIASPYGIFSIEEGYQIHEIRQYAALGTGENFALGSLATTRDIVVTIAAWKRTELAIYSAIEHCSECDGETVTRIYQRHEDNSKKKG